MPALTDLVYIDSTGYHYSPYPDFLTWIQGQYQSIYGADVYIEADSQDGQFLAIISNAFYDTAALGASNYNSFSPTSAQGIGLSRLVKINGIQRLVPTFSTVSLQIVGTNGTVITNGIAIDTLGQKWDLPTTVTIPGGGTITVTATAEMIGAINAQSNTVNSIFTPTLGWQSVNNSSAATPGSPVESDAALRQRQAISVANPSLTVLDGQVGAVRNVTGVTAVKPYENDTNITDANSIPPHTVSLVVQGGDDAEVADEIAKHKTPGTGTYGSTSIVVTDKMGMPLTINFYRPTTATIHVEIDLDALDGWSTDFETLIAQSVADFINSIGIGNNVLYSRMYGPAYLNGNPLASTYNITSLQISKNGGSFGTSDLSILFNELPFCDPTTDITITPS